MGKVLVFVSPSLMPETIFLWSTGLIQSYGLRFFLKKKREKKVNDKVVQLCVSLMIEYVYFEDLQTGLRGFNHIYRV